MTAFAVRQLLASIDQRTGPWKSCSVRLHDAGGGLWQLVVDFKARDQDAAEWDGSPEAEEGFFFVPTAPFELEDIEYADQVIECAFRLVCRAALHEIAEGFYVDDVRVRDPRKVPPVQLKP